MAKGRVLSAKAGHFNIYSQGKFYLAAARGKLKTDKIITGDIVEFNDTGDVIITEVYPRKNAIIRPQIANIDQLLIVIASMPQPDFNLVDKQLVIAALNNITPILVINKQDIASTDFIDSVISQYQDVVDIVICSAIKSDIDALKKVLKNKVSVLSGQSAVGKSSIINAVFNLSEKTNEVSQKTSRGRHTTKDTKFYIYDDIILADSPGFSSLMADIKYDQLKYYYPEFSDIACKYNGCNHIDEQPCKVKDLVKEGKINADRYNRYAAWYKALKEEYLKRYR